MSSLEAVGDVVAAIQARTERIVEGLDRVGEGGLAAPSALPGWTRLTVACHLRYGAEALSRMTRAALSGAAVSYYPKGREVQRPLTLRPNPGERPPHVLLSLADHGAQLAGIWSHLSEGEWSCPVHEPPGREDLGPLRLADLAVLRLTEVEVHGSDLLIGLDDWSEIFVSIALPFRLDRLNHRRLQPSGNGAPRRGSWLLSATGGPTYLVGLEDGVVESHPAAPTAPAGAVIRTSRRDLLALLLGRPLSAPPTIAGDRELGLAFTEVFPGP